MKNVNHIRTVVRTGLFLLAAVPAVLVTACAPPTGGGGWVPPAAPGSIHGLGHYDLTLNTSFAGTWGAEYAMTRTGDVYTGMLDSTDDAQDRVVELTVSGHTVTGVYTAQVGMDPGTGLELTTSNVTAATVTDAEECPGADALELTIYGTYTSNGVPTTLSANPVVWTICDPAAAQYFS